MRVCAQRGWQVARTQAPPLFMRIFIKHTHQTKEYAYEIAIETRCIDFTQTKDQQKAKVAPDGKPTRIKKKTAVTATTPAESTEAADP